MIVLFFCIDLVQGIGAAFTALVLCSLFKNFTHIIFLFVSENNNEEELVEKLRKKKSRKNYILIGIYSKIQLALFPIYGMTKFFYLLLIIQFKCKQNS